MEGENEPKKPEAEVGAELQAVAAAADRAQPAAGLRARLESLGRMALLVFILGAAAFLSAITAIRLAIQGRDVEVPSVVGLKAGDAQAKLAGRGLGLRIVDRIYSDLPVDHVIRQSPLAGTHVKVSQRAYVVVSRGPRKLPIPPLEGKSIRAARLELLRAGLQVGEVSSSYLPAEQPELIIKQSPPAGEMGAGSPRVNLLVALGERAAAYVMPDLVGLPLSEAQRRMNAAGLRLAGITLAARSDVPHGAVLQQTPPRGARVPAGAAVELQVAE